MKIINITKTATLAVVAGAVALGVAAPSGAVAGTMYGDPAAAAKWWRYQKYDDCVLMASADVIGQVTGKEPSEEAIIKMAQATPSTDHPGSIYAKPADTRNPNSGMGTSPLDIPTLLAQYQIGSVLTDKKHAPADGFLPGIEGLKKDPRNPALNFHFAKLLAADPDRIRAAKARSYLAKALADRGRLSPTMAREADQLGVRLSGILGN